MQRPVSHFDNWTDFRDFQLIDLGIQTINNGMDSSYAIKSALWCVKCAKSCEYKGKKLSSITQKRYAINTPEEEIAIFWCSLERFVIAAGNSFEFVSQTTVYYIAPFLHQRNVLHPSFLLDVEQELVMLHE